ncbi:structural maintenance of chromosomes flexible hinge domain-containing protein 1-like isoform X2 [Mercenaria mercenaria]|uniref:structural maintenance of chromosomes flexible hinge domain-containing protein 1-like isoform X2 n=1 Tax=Mercenaria mercenaria TaxID=6596 RepID=UPI00234F7611|nr:structural maintenance of chromosomes flexible hinge domain-containing protein 1-like isoform X2 [Mercenaria mercenaria]
MAAHKADRASEEADSFVFVYDRREKDAPEAKITTGGITSFKAFKERLIKSLGLKSNEKFVVATTNREEIKDDESWGIVDKGDTVYVLRSLDQELCAPVQERVNYLPHYDTIVKGGMYEYYASEGQNPLPYAFAELIDNSLAATRNNTGPRNIEIRLHLDEATVYVIDNGKGMTSRQLNNWAIYRLSKFNRKDRKTKGNLDETEEEESFVDQDLPKSLNSDISYFGVGGKQAIFFIGTSTRMISKPLGSQDVHELIISKEEFEKKERNNEEIYSGFIRKRKLGDASHISTEDEVLRRMVEEEEKDRENFTVVVIQGISKDHLQYLKDRMPEWTRQLAHIYHYYLHGPAGNVDSEENKRAPSPFKNIDIEIKLWSSRSADNPRTINLRDIDDDMQTLFVRGAASSFEFKAIIEGAKVEGVLRYHPFLYDRETYPMDMYDRTEVTFEDEHDYAISDIPARGRRPIFECFWNGRLIPYTTIDSFEWCNPPKKAKNVAAECYNRVSGVLWTDDNFQVSTNKLTFIDLELRLRDKLAAFTRVVNGQERRTGIEKEFSNWLKECHEQHDKSIHFTQYMGQILRLDLPKQRQSPWSAYKQVDWDGKVFKNGQLVKILRTNPPLLGSINRILLYGDHQGDVYATGGDLEIVQEPRSMYSEVKIVPLSKLDRTTSAQMVKKYIDEEEAKLPNSLEITWPEGNAVSKNQKRKTGETIGDIRVEILNKKGDAVSKLPGKDNASKKLLVELKVIWASPTGLQTIVSHISQHGKTWPYWFRKMENIKNLGAYTLQLQAVLNESGENMFAGKQLPCEKISFQVVEGEAETFSVGVLEGPFRVGVPFTIPLDLHDSFGNPARAPAGQEFHPKLEASGLDLKYSVAVVKGHSVSIKDVVAKGQVQGTSGKNFNLNITIPELKSSSQVLKIRLLPGPASVLYVSPEEEQTVINGISPTFKIQLQDSAGNPTALEGRSVVCKLVGAPNLPSYSMECSSTGSGTLVGDPILLKKMKSELSLTAKFDVQGNKLIKTVDRKIRLVPSGKACEVRVFFQEPDMSEKVQITNGMEITKPAGETLQGLTYALYDEAEQELPLDDKVISKVKLNWVAKPPKDLLQKGQLPGVKATNTVQEVKYCQVTVTESSGIELGFVLKTITGEPKCLNCTCSGTNQISIGQPLAGEIQVKVRDKYGNDVQHDSENVCKDLKISGEGLKVDRCKILLDKQTKSMLIKGVVFEGGTIGRKEVQITWRSLKDYLRLEMVAGPPAKMKFIHYSESQEVLVYNESKFAKPLAIQLLDEGDNACRTPDIRMQLARDVKLKLIPTVQPTKTNKDGIADFGIFTVSCGRGLYELQPKAFISAGFVLSGPKLKISVQPDPTRPSNLDVSYNNKATYTAGESMPEYTVKIYAEDDSLLASAKPSHVSLKLWKSDDADATNLPSRTLSYHPESSRKTETGIFHFKNIKCPDESGSYNVMFVYYDGKHQLFSNVIHIKIDPSTPVQLVCLDNPGTATVSNTKNYATRCIVRNLKLELRDKYDNHVTKGMNGSIVLEIASATGEKELPVFAGAAKNKTISATLAGGTSFIQNIALQENSPGKDGYEYQLKCSVNCNNVPKSLNMEPYILPFLFYDDAKKQSEMAALSKERDNLQNAIRTYKSLFETTEQLIEELKISVKEAKSEESKIRDELRKQRIPMSTLNSVESIEKLVKDFNERKDVELNKKRRVCSLPTIMANDPEVLGKIGHLAQISDDDAARVLSWHMSSDMDCVVTMTTKKAKEIYNQTNGRQQVLPLDSIFKKSLTEWNKPLPHIKYKPNWKPTGNLIFARNLIAFWQNEDKCKTVFSMLLGDTLWIDTLDQANEYRRELVKYTNCPTILTREGDRIRSNGKFGGLMNKAPPVEKLRGAVFGAPVPDSYHQLCSTIDVLQNLKSALVAHKTAETELKEQMETIKAPEMQAKYEECREVEKQLQALEKKLGVVGTPVRDLSFPKVAKRTPDRDEDGGPANKRLRSSPAMPEVNGTTNSNFLTPTRTSRRIAAMTPTTDTDGRKRLKKS